MNHQRAWIKLSLSAVVGLVLTQSAFSSEYKIDGAHSSVGFEVRHLVSKVPGDFKDFEGTFSFDPKKPEDSKVNAKIKVDSINTNQPKRDGHLKSPDFFDAQKFPTIAFVSTKVTAKGENKYMMTGDLTMHGVTKPVNLDVEYMGEIEAMGAHKAGFSASGKLNRKDFGINWNKTLDKGTVLSDDVTLNINVEADQKAEKAEKAKK